MFGARCNASTNFKPHLNHNAMNTPMKNSEQPIYPIISEERTSEYANMPDTLLQCVSSGLTKREYFAAMAMQGYLASYGPAEPVNSQHVAEKAVKCAGALLTELEKSNQ